MKSDHVLKAKDVKMGRNKDKLRFMLHTSKKHWHGDKPQVITIASAGLVKANEMTGTWDICPFYNVQHFLQIRKSRKRDDEQFFIFRDRSPVLPEHFRTVLARSVNLAGLDSRYYRSRGFRAGCAVDMLTRLHLSIETIKKFGHWRSNAVYRYLAI